VVPGLGEVEDGERLGGLTAGDQKGSDATLQSSDALLHGVLGGIHDARVDVPRLGEAEERGRVVGVAEHVRGGLVDRQRAGTGRGVSGLAGVDLLGLERPGGGVGGHGGSVSA
jgi:hypothetical protein